MPGFAFFAGSQQIIRKTALTACAITFILGLLQPGLPNNIAWAKGGKKGASEAELKKTLETVDKSLTELSAKLQSRELFSPKDSGDLENVKEQLLELTQTFPGNAALTKPLYLTGVLCAHRDLYDEAYDLLNRVVAVNGDLVYASRAKVEIIRMKRKLGNDFFSTEETASSAAPAAATTAPSSTADKKNKG